MSSKNDVWWWIGGLGAAAAAAALFFFMPKEKAPDNPVPPPAPPPTSSDLPPPPPAPEPGKGGLEWLYVQVWRWTTSGWQLDQTIGPQQTTWTAEKQASFIAALEAPPFYYGQVYRWSAATRTWNYAAGAGNY